MLLLEGDEFFVNHDGICRTYYDLKQWSGGAAQQQQQHSPPVSIEEEYNLKQARKTYTLRRRPNKKSSQQQQSPSTLLLSRHVQGVVDMGIPTTSKKIVVQEIDQGVFGSAGTGATTWESSLAMTMLFSVKPELLQGHVLELGSGVGVGGILLSHVLATSSPSSSMSSLTLTDGNLQVLQECRGNCQQSATKRFPIHIEQFLWNDDNPPAHRRLFDTIFASDCAYKYPDVLALALAMKRSLAPLGTIHIFGPYNRGALQQLLVELQQRGLVVQVNGLEMNRYRLKSASSSNKGYEEEGVYASRNVARFLHITATHASASSSSQSRHDDDDDDDETRNIHDID